MSVVEPFPSRHAIKLTLPWGFQVGDPLVVFSFEKLSVKLRALLLAKVLRSWRNKMELHQNLLANEIEFLTLRAEFFLLQTRSNFQYFGMLVLALALVSWLA